MGDTADIKDSRVPNLDKMKSSFESHFNEDPERMDMYRPAFAFLVSALDELPMEGVYVDVSLARQSVKFCVNLGYKVLLMVERGVNDDGNDVTYSIYHDNTLMALDVVGLDELMDMVTEMLDKLCDGLD